MLAKRFLLIFLLALLLVPVIQARFHFSKEAGLAGAFTQSPRAIFSWEGMLDNSYQTALERYLEDRIGFRPYLVKMRNQLSFSLFRVARSSDIVVGQHDVLFQPGPIASYAGKDLLDPAEVQFRARRLQLVHHELARRGVQLLFVMAPNKARFQPESVPSYLLPAPGTRTNYEQFVRALRADSVPLLDLVPVFARWKTTLPYALFPSGGTHWSGYGATLAADTLLHHLERLGNMQFPTVRTVGPPRIVHQNDSVRGTDNDITSPLNLLWTPEPAPLAYRQLAFAPPGPGQTRPSALFVGDSFTWGLMLFSPYMQREFADDTRFWYYNTKVFQPDSIYHETGEVPGSLDLRQQLEGRRFVILLLTEHNLVENEFGFTNQVYRLYHPLTEADQVAIGRLARQLARQATWEEQAKDPEGFEQRIRQQAQNMYERQQLR